ncbi:MAG: DMT family transporter [Elusimicrobia bacterium]|nr:DMT family transporter [Elusimicrobiota bacterium]
MSGSVYLLIGSAAALLSAASWAFSSILFRKVGDDVTPFGMTLGKSVIGIMYLGAVLAVIGVEPVTSRAFIFLSLSGLLGIAAGDTLYFKALMQLGPRLLVLLGLLGPVITVVLSLLVLHEQPSRMSWFGMILTMAGVYWILWEKNTDAGGRDFRMKGILTALLSFLCTAAGIILAKIGVKEMSAIQATCIRLFWGGAGVFAAGMLKGRIRTWLSPMLNRRTLFLMLFTVFIAIFGGFWLFILSLKYIDASIAVVLNSTTPLFILPMTFLIYREKIYPHTIAGALLAVAGVSMLFAG